MSQTLATSPPAVVLGARYRQLRSVLALACVLIVGLSIAVVILATSRTSSPAKVTSAPVKVTSARAASEAGARLDHRGLHDAWYLFALRETGARLDHRGTRVPARP
jgi:hypothetical protein